MDESIDRELETILTLVKLTQDGELKWKAVKPWGDLKETDTTKYSPIMFCDYKNTKLRIFIERYRIDAPNKLDNVFSAASLFDAVKSYPYWNETEVLEITNGDGQSLWRFGHKSAIKDLFNAVRYQVAGVKELFDDVLSKSPKLRI